MQNPKDAYTEQMVDEEMDSLGDGARREMRDHVTDTVADTEKDDSAP